MKDFSEIKRAGFIGIGLIGGCILRNIRKYYPKTEVLAYDYSMAERGIPSRSVDDALREGIIHETTAQLKDFKDCDIIFLCAPVKDNLEYLTALKDIIKDSCIITDVGSVKGIMHKKAESLGLSKNFVGGHPMAGSEKTGFINSYSGLIINAYYVITVTEDTDIEKAKLLLDMVKTFGSIPVLENCNDHDKQVAYISHLPHIIAFELVNLVRDNDDSEQSMKKIAAGGFKDITRIASSSSLMWESICSTNKECIIEALDTYMENLRKFRHILESQDSVAMIKEFDKAREYRDTISPRHKAE